MKKMITIFAKRVQLEWRYKLRLWTGVIDWVVWLYLLIPLIGIGIYHYTTLWNQTAAWAEHIPYLYLVIGVFFYSISGRLHLFVEKADQLFLIQNESWVRQLMRWSILYSFIVNVFQTVVTTGAIAPILINYIDFSLVSLSLLFLVLTLFRFLMMGIEDMISIFVQGWKRLLILGVAYGGIFGLFLLPTYFYTEQVVVQLLFLFILSLMISIGWKRREKIAWSFEEDCIRASERKNSGVQVLMTSAMYIGAPDMTIKKQKRKKKRPWIFRQSTLLFKQRSTQNGLVELYLKSFIRNWKLLLSFIQLQLVFFYAVFVLPYWVKWGVAAVFIFVLYSFLAATWMEMQKSPFLQMFRLDELEAMKASRKGVLYLMVPSLTLLGILMLMLSIL
ncbi:ABC transporter permease [Caldalkalibacillus mannanilyticus]|uniref:ABC transporter permease n=1 Tax=Caldalkalibacillus mannanilyticus TaxID=1418 RepID=UPI0004699A14|nr:ABC transporter permease [Caldalkalibacillus mannanilyticus]